MKRLVVALATAVFAVAIASPVAGADPTHAKNSALIMADCGGQAVMVSVNGNSQTHTCTRHWPGASVFVPTALGLAWTFRSNRWA